DRPQLRRGRGPLERRPHHLRGDRPPGPLLRARSRRRRDRDARAAGPPARHGLRPETGVPVRPPPSPRGADRLRRDELPVALTMSDDGDDPVIAALTSLLAIIKQ